jgi:TetR/AcrR family transcriptional repressor of nem operon
MMAIMIGMKVSKATAAAHRLALLEQAGRLFRRHGIEAVGVAEVTRAAGLTHGAFYGHFPSKAALAAEATSDSLLSGAARWRRRAARARAAGADPLAAIVAAYLSPSHRDSPEQGCALASLGPEASRAEAALAGALHQGVDSLLAVLGEELAARGMPADRRRGVALAMLSAMTGGIVLARALAADDAASRAALDAAAVLALDAATSR